jgi:hypothetical protein
LSWASCNEPIEGGDWLGCAHALVAHGMAGQADAAMAGCVVIEGHHYQFSENVATFSLEGKLPNEPKHRRFSP